QWVVVKAAADIVVAPLGQRLILVIGRAVGKLDRGDVDDPLSGPLRYNVYKAVEVLAGIPEAHAPTGAGFVIGSGAAHVKGHHTLVLMPDVDHAVELFVVGLELEFAQQLIPVAREGFLGLIHSGEV